MLVRNDKKKKEQKYGVIQLCDIRRLHPKSFGRSVIVSCPGVVMMADAFRNFLRLWVSWSVDMDFLQGTETGSAAHEDGVT